MLTKKILNIKLEHVPCTLCNSDDYEIIHSFLESGINIVKCKQCGLSYLNPRLIEEEIRNIYQKDYFSNDFSVEYGYDNYIKSHTEIANTSRRRLKFIEKYIQKGSLLDIGCATGVFLKEAQNRGWQVEGVEISKYAWEYATTVYQLKVFNGTLKQKISLSNIYYDVVTMWDYIEHVPNPVEEIREVSRILKKDGFLFLTTPDINSIPAKITRSRWLGFKKYIEHLYYFEFITIKKLLEQSGFQILYKWYTGKYITQDIFIARLISISKIFNFLNCIKTDKLSLYINPFDIMVIAAQKVK